MSVTDAAGNPVPGKPVIFKVTQNDGLVTAGDAARAHRDRDDRRAGAGAGAVDARHARRRRRQHRRGLLRRLQRHRHLHRDRHAGAGRARSSSTPATIRSVRSASRCRSRFIAVVVDDGNNRLGGVPVTFTVSEGGGSFDGQPSVTVTTDPDGRVAATLTLGMQEGNANNLVEATFESNQGFPAAFTASGRAPGDPAKTTITGVVLDNSNLPIPGVTVRAVHERSARQRHRGRSTRCPAVQTDAQGQFTIPQAPVGFVELLVDGSTAAPTGTYPSLEYDMVTVAGQNNTVGLPIYLLPLKTANQLCVTDTTGGGTLTIPEAPGFSLTFGPGQVTFPGGSKTGCVSVTVVHRDKVPMVPGFGQQPRFIVTIQPAGAVFNPPAAITLPNVDGLKPRAVTEMYSFDHDISSFVAIGTGTVSDDGLVIRSNPGVGVLKAGWHCGGNPTTTGNAGSVSVSLTSLAKKAIQYGSNGTVLASGSPPIGGQYGNWRITNETFAPGIVAFDDQPTCDDKSSCSNVVQSTADPATLPNNSSVCGTATMEVTFTCPAYGLSDTATATLEVGCGGQSASECRQFCDSLPAQGMCGVACSMIGHTPAQPFDPVNGDTCWQVTVDSVDYCYWDVLKPGPQPAACCPNRCEGSGQMVWGQLQRPLATTTAR